MKKQPSDKQWSRFSVNQIMSGMGRLNKVTVVGAGIIGVAIAFELQRRGKQVVLVDCNEPGRGASFGNMASIAVTEFMPASRPSVWAQMPKWLLDPQGPVRVRPSYLPKLTPWFLRFLEASRPSRVKELEAAGAVLCGRVYEDLLALLDAAGLSGELSQEGCLSLYADEQEFNADREHIEVLERFGFAHEVVGVMQFESLNQRSRQGSVGRFCSRRTVRCGTRFVSSRHCSIDTARLVASSRAGRSLDLKGLTEPCRR